MSCILLIQGTSYGQKKLNFDTKELISFQQSLIDDEITGSNVAMIYSEGERIYHEIVQSHKKGDKDIDKKTIFPIWSMTKPVTIVSNVDTLTRISAIKKTTLQKILTE